MQYPAEIYVPPRDLIELQLAQIWIALSKYSPKIYAESIILFRLVT
jgi:hypothetical protein